MAMVAMVLCAIAVTSKYMIREPIETPPTVDRRPVRVEDWQGFADSGTLMGPAGARVTITEFSDFQCPYCARLASSLKALRAKYPADLRVSYRHYPISGRHAFAETAALASECAARHGKFEEYHDLLFSVRDSLGVVPWITLAERVGIVPLQQFRTCVDSSLTIGRVRADVAAAKRLDISGTPLLLVNEWRLVGAVPLPVLDSIVAGLLAKMR